MGQERVKAASLVRDYDLYPRHKESSTNVADLVKALEAGVPLPPVIADEKSRKVVDGFHRVEAVLRHFGPEADIEVQWRTYRNDGARLEDAIRLNGRHGEKFSGYDRVRCVILAERCGLKMERVARALNMTPERLGTLELARTAFGPDKEVVPLKRSLAHLAQESMTDRQLEGQRGAAGVNQMFLVNQLIRFIEYDLLDEDNEGLMQRLAVLHQLLEQRPAYVGKDAEATPA